MSPPGPRQPSSATRFGPPLQGGDVVRAVLLGFALYAIGVFVVIAVGAGVETPAGRVNYLIAFYAVSTASWLGAVWLVFIRQRGFTFADLGYIVPEPVWAMRGVLAGFIALPLAFVISILLRQVVGSESSTDLQQYFGGVQFGPIQALTIILYLGFLVPIAEELVFRGLIFRWLRQRFEFWSAAFLSGVTFGVLHFVTNWRVEQMVITALLGVAMAWLYEKSRTLAAPILMHQTYNSLIWMLQFAYIWFGQART